MKILGENFRALLLIFEISTVYFETIESGLWKMFRSRGSFSSRIATFDSSLRLGFGRNGRFDWTNEN